MCYINVIGNKETYASKLIFLLESNMMLRPASVCACNCVSENIPNHQPIELIIYGNSLKRAIKKTKRSRRKHPFLDGFICWYDRRKRRRRAARVSVEPMVSTTFACGGGGLLPLQGQHMETKLEQISQKITQSLFLGGIVTCTQLIERNRAEGCFAFKTSRAYTYIFINSKHRTPWVSILRYPRFK